MRPWRPLAIRIFWALICVYMIIYIGIPKVSKRSLSVTCPKTGDSINLTRQSRSVTTPKQMKITNNNNMNITQILEMYHPKFKYWNTYTKTELQIFIFSAILSDNVNFNSKKVSNDSINGLDYRSLPLVSRFTHVVKINAWESVKHLHTPIKCCYIWDNNRTTENKTPIRGYWKRWTLSAVQYTCLLNKTRELKGVFLQYLKGRCDTGFEHVVKPIAPLMQKKDSFGVCLKIAFGDIDPKLIVDWMEYYKEMKVDTVYATTYNLSSRARKVFDYYSKTGLVHQEPFEYPRKHVHNERRKIGEKVQSVFNDEQVVVFDCFARLRGYTYFAVLDLDEFLLPSDGSDLKKMMWRLRKIYPNAGGYSFKTFLFFKDWGVSGSPNGSDIVRYVQRTGPMMTRTKNVLLPGRISEGSVLTHEFKAAEGYTRVVVPYSTAALHHYRYCYKNTARICKRGPSRKDTRILKVVNRFNRRSTEVLKKLS